MVTLGLASAALGGVARSAVETRVEVTFSDTSFTLTPASLNAGPTTFVVLNKGKRSHALEITGPGLRGARTTKLAAGKSATLTVTLHAGAYMLSDPVGLSAYNVQYIDVVPASVVSSTGASSSVVNTNTTTNPACGQQYLQP